LGFQLPVESSFASGLAENERLLTGALPLGVAFLFRGVWLEEELRLLFVGLRMLM
jgi:hypothetical protein